MAEQSLTEPAEMGERARALRAHCIESTLRAAVKEGGPGVKDNPRDQPKGESPQLVRIATWI
jgi:hypothetical protein